MGPTEAGVYAYTQVSSLSLIFTYVSGSWIATECFLNVQRTKTLRESGAYRKNEIRGVLIQIKMI